MKTVLLALFLTQDPVLERLVFDLGADEIGVRDKAAAALVDFGDAAEREIRRLLPSLGAEAGGRANDVLRRIDAERQRRKFLPPARRVSIDARDRFLGEVAAEIGLPIDAPPDRKITLSLADAPPLQAVDAMAAAAGMRWVPAPAVPSWEWTESHPRFQPLYPLKKGTEPAMPKVYVGRYRISAPSVTFGSDDGTVGKTIPLLQLVLRWPADVHPEEVTSKIASVTDEHGAELMQWIEYKGKQIDMGAVGSIQGALTSEAKGTLILKPVSPQATRLSVRGRMILRYPNPRQILSLESAGQTLESRGVAVTLKEFVWNETRGKVALETLGTWERTTRPEDELFHSQPCAINSLERLRLRAEDGTILSSGGGSMSPLGRTRLARKTVSHWELRSEFSSPKPLKIVAVEAVVVPDWTYETAEFEIKDIPLPGK